MEGTTPFPSDYGIMHKGHHACAVFSVFLFDMAYKIQDTATPEQIRKWNELQTAYAELVGDISHVYRLEYLIGVYQDRCMRQAREITDLRLEVEKLTKTLEFQQG